MPRGRFIATRADMRSNRASAGGSWWASFTSPSRTSTHRFSERLRTNRRGAEGGPGTKRCSTRTAEEDEVTEVKKRLMEAHDAERALQEAPNKKKAFEAYERVERAVRRLRDELEHGQQEDAFDEEEAAGWLVAWDQDPSSAPLPAADNDKAPRQRGVRVRSVDTPKADEEPSDA